MGIAPRAPTGCIDKARAHGALVLALPGAIGAHAQLNGGAIAGALPYTAKMVKPWLSKAPAVVVEIPKCSNAPGWMTWKQGEITLRTPGTTPTAVAAYGSIAGDEQFLAGVRANGAASLHPGP